MRCQMYKKTWAGVVENVCIFVCWHGKRRALWSCMELQSQVHRHCCLINDSRPLNQAVLVVSCL